MNFRFSRAGSSRARIDRLRDLVRGKVAGTWRTAVEWLGKPFSNNETLRRRRALHPVSADGDFGRRRLGFGRHLFIMRAYGLTASVPAVTMALSAHNHAGLTWLLLLHWLAWPPLAYWRMQRHADPVRAEFGNLDVDAILGGAWIALLGFDALPSASIAGMLLMDRVIAGGWRFGLKSMALTALACVAASAVCGWRFEPVTDYTVMLACLPLMIGYPLAMATTMRRFTERTLAAKRTLEENTRFDAATGLVNRQQFVRAAEQALERYRREGRHACLALIDIDHFKQINDRHGHTVGDSVIVQFARLLRLCLREVDTGGRYGGDEFGIVMPDMQWPEAIVAAERLRKQVAGSTLFPEGLRCTISVGLAECNAQTGSVTRWVDLADAALYAAKRRGRDCIEVARPFSNKGGVAAADASAEAG